MTTRQHIKVLWNVDTATIDQCDTSVTTAWRILSSWIGTQLLHMFCSVGAFRQFNLNLVFLSYPQCSVLGEWFIMNKHSENETAKNVSNCCRYSARIYIFFTYTQIQANWKRKIAILYIQMWTMYYKDDEDRRIDTAMQRQHMVQDCAT